MTIHVTFNRQLGIIEVNGYGEILRSEMEEANAEIIRIHEEEGINKILGDVAKVEKGPGIADTYDIFSEFPQGFRHAILLRNSDPTGNDAGFIEDVGVNRGYKIRIFEIREDALRWLFKE